MNSILNKVEIVNFELIHRDSWDNFCLNESEAWFWHTSSRIEHALEVAGNSGNNQSFSVFLNNKVIAICPLIVSMDNDHFVISYSGWGTPAPIVSSFLSISNRKKIKNLIYNQIEIIALQFNVSKILLSKFPQIINTENPYFFYNDFSIIKHYNFI